MIIVGAGSMGMAARYFLAKKGVDVLLVDAFDPPHELGSHNGDTRTIRHAYGEGAQYVPLVLRAQELWYELEQESGESLFVQTGVLGIGSGNSRFIKETIKSAQIYSLPAEVLSGAEIRQVPDDFIGCFETTSGVLFNQNCIVAYRKLAEAYGARFLMNTRVEQIDLRADSAEIVTKSGCIRADKLIVTSGAWTGKLLSGMEPRLQPVRKVLGWFEAEESLYNDCRFPVFFFELGGPFYYGTPSLGGSGIKIGRHDGGLTTDPDMTNRSFGVYPSDEQDLQQFIQTYLPKGVGRFSKGGVCLYTKYPIHKREIIANWPKARQGYHVILAVRDMADNKNAFYQSIDIQLVNP